MCTVNIVEACWPLLQYLKVVANGTRLQWPKVMIEVRKHHFTVANYSIARTMHCVRTSTPCFPGKRLPPILESGFKTMCSLNMRASASGIFRSSTLEDSPDTQVAFSPSQLSAYEIEVMINAIFTLPKLIGELSLRFTWHTTFCTWSAPDVLRVICSRLRPSCVSCMQTTNCGAVNYLK